VWLASTDPHASAHYPSQKAAEQYYPAEHIAAAFWKWITADAVSFFTAVLGVFTAVLAVVSFVQIRYLRNADITARDTASAALKAATAASDQVAEMKRASGLAETQNAIVADQTDLQKRQHELDRRQFFATHRPRFVARQFQIFDFQPTQSPMVRFAIFNIGATSGYIREYNTSVVLLDGFGRIFGLPRYETIPTEVSDIEIKAGGAYYLVTTDITPIDPADFIAVGDKTKIMHIFGYIRYADDMGTIRRTGFLRGFDVTLRRFRPVDDPEYEYAD
jgi:hypothetical protein